MQAIRFVKQVSLIAILSAAAGILVTVPAAASCTLYASPSGNSRNSGTSSSSPIPLLTAVNRSRPGYVVCLMAGQYYVNTPMEIQNSGNAASWIVYTSYNGVAEILPGSGSQALFRLPSGVHNVEIKGLEFEGKNTAVTGVACSGCNHVRIIGNKISHMGSAGIATYNDGNTGERPDYVTADHNLIYHCGYKQGFGSAISYARHRWYDSYPGFHSFVTNNIISGMYDNSYHHTDGNGIISDNEPGDVTPPELIANNVIYQNGRRCIFGRYSTNTWVVNNTCYKNGLDRIVGEFQTYYTSGMYQVNNISYAWNTNYPYLDTAPQVDTHYHYNHWITSGWRKPEVIPSSASGNPAEIEHSDPVFVNPPYVSPTGSGQYNNAVPPENITDQFHLKSGSPAIGAGIDPTSLPGVPYDIAIGLRAYVYTDIEGKRRVPGSHFDLGAYTH